MNELPFDKFIAHYREIDNEPQYLIEHLQCTAKLAARFAAKIGLEKQGELAGLLHDSGKATMEFYRYICSATGLINPDEDDYLSAEDYAGKIDHSSAGAHIISNYFKGKGPEALYVAQIFSLIIASHHSGLIDCITPDGINKYAVRMNKADKLTRLSEVEANLNTSTINERITSLLEEPQLISELIEVSKRLGDGNDSKATMAFKRGLLVRFLFSCLIDADRTDTAVFENLYEKRIREEVIKPQWDLLISRLENHLQSFKVNNRVDEIRNDIAAQCLSFAEKDKGVFQLTVPTGGGKTLSSLRFALHHAQKHKMDRIIYVIPYTSIIDQNADVVRSILESPADNNLIVLENHSNLIPEKESTKQKVLAQTWDAPIVFTTMVQFLETLFGAGTRSARRFHQLANSVLIFDEIQTLPLRCVYMFNTAIRFLISVCGTTIVLCTATQPMLDEVEPFLALSIPNDRKIISDVPSLFNKLKRVDVFDKTKSGGWSEKEITDLAEQELQVTGSVLIIVNTKNAARSIFKQLNEKYRASPVEICHLSTSMCPTHRRDILKNIKKKLDPKNSQPIICVSTQLIEAGVDIDFGSVIRYLAGLDSIAQAAGRCNRNGGRTITGRVTIVNPENENLDRLVDIKKGAEQARRVLYDFAIDSASFDDNRIGDKAIKRYYQYYFHERRNIMDYPVGGQSKIGREDSLFRLLSGNELSVKTYERISRQPYKAVLKQSFTSAADQFQSIDQHTRGVVVPYQDGKDVIKKLCSDLNMPEYYQQLKLAQSFSVNLFSHEFEKLIQQGGVFETQKGSGVYYLDERNYSEYFGASLTEDNDVELPPA